ncbi:hypothetical protein Jab_2c00170 [Janthinobacterium sp. HH01]|uniref:PepSY-associated TM helix domain-containing protein n=1 Tax=Janthinobacterium sp. HH01 TaxID=1198452 RepID=UPI0002AE9ABE|nr:PepSY domain-containing protein [Janthinobacterium sp. HH01]ELX07976.1 hypothetical protein Jab_2c00170 [Janthinobacterium sp. HH01]
MPATEPARKRRDMRIWWRSAHRWLAYVFGAFFVVQGLSGSLLVLSDPLDDWLNPELTVPAARRVPLVDMADALERQHPGAVGIGVTQIDDAGRLTTGFWPTPDPLIPSERRYWLARLHPGTGEALVVTPYGAWSLDRRDLIGLLYALHTSLTLGAVGKLLQIVTAACLLVLLAAGAITAVNRWRAVRGKAAAAIVDTAPARWHRRIGSVAALALAILLASGLALQFETVLDPAFGYRSQPAASGQRLTLRQAWTVAHQRYGDAETRLIMAPFTEGGVFRIDMVPRSGPQRGEKVEVFVDAYSGRVMKERRASEREGIQQALGVLEALHGGKLLGAGGQALALLAGLLPLLLLTTGLVMRRRRSK